MKRNKLLIALSFVIFGIFTVDFIFSLVSVITNPARNFGVLWLIPSFISLATYLLLAILQMTGAVTRKIAGSLLASSILMSLAPPLLLLSFFGTFAMIDVFTGLVTFLPILFCILPLAVFLKCK